MDVVDVVNFQLRSVTKSGMQLEVRFAWQRDRFAHQIVLVREVADGDLLLASSQEGAGPSAWPPSPPIQQLDRCDLSDGRDGLVGVGMAGRSHWSLAVEPRPGELWFDVACRTQTPADALGSQYATGAAWHPDVARQRWMATGSDAPVAISVGTEHGCSYDVVAAEPSFRIQPSPTADAPQTTVRWKYGFQLQID